MRWRTGTLEAMSCFGCWPTCSFSRLPMRSATTRAQKEKVLVLFGDSNFHYGPERTILAKLIGWQPESMGDMVRKELSGRAILVSSSSLNYTIRVGAASLRPHLAVHAGEQMRIAGIAETLCGCLCETCPSALLQSSGRGRNHAPKPLSKI